MDHRVSRFLITSTATDGDDAQYEQILIASTATDTHGFRASRRVSLLVLPSFKLTATDAHGPPSLPIFDYIDGDRR